MDVVTFITELLSGLSTVEAVQGVTSQAEGPIVRGRAQVREGLFLAFYFNQETGTEAFTLVKNEQRVWGIDYDGLRGWHEHPVNRQEEHVIIETQTIASVRSSAGGMENRFPTTYVSCLASPVCGRSLSVTSLSSTNAPIGTNTTCATGLSGSTSTSWPAPSGLSYGGKAPIKSLTPRPSSSSRRLG